MVESPKYQAWTTSDLGLYCKKTRKSSVMSYGNITHDFRLFVSIKVPQVAIISKLYSEN